MKTLFYIWLGALVVVSGSGALGAMLLSAIRIRVSRTEAYALAFLTGSALFTVLWMGLGIAGFVDRGVAYAVSGVLLVVAGATRSYRVLGGNAREETAERLSAWGLAGFGLLFLPYLWVYIMYALHPEVSADGTYYHNGFLNQYAIAHRIAPFADSFYATLSQGSEIQALPGFLIGKHCVPGMVQLVYLLAVTALIVRFGSRLAGPKAGWTAGFLFFATPVVGYVSNQALNDIATGAAFFGTFYCLQRWWTTREEPWLVPAGLLAGLAYATKYSAFLAVVGFVAVLGWRLLRRRDVNWKWAAAGCAGVALLVLPYVMRNWIWYDNPVAPFYNAWFPNEHFSSWVEIEFRENQKTYGWLKHYWQVPWDVAFGGRNLQGIVGPITLLLPLGLLALRKPGGKLLFVCGCVALSTYPQNVGARFLIPALPFFLLLLSTVAVRWREALGALLAMQAVACWPALVRAYTDPYALILAPLPTVAQVTRETPEEETLIYRLNTYLAARWLDKNVRPGERVLAYNVYVEAYSGVHACVVHASTHCFKLADVFGSAASPGERPTREWEFGFRRRTVEQLRLLQTGSGRDRWNMREIELYRDGLPVPLPLGTRLEASRNEGDLGYLHDGNLVTGWSPWEFMAPGQFVVLRFPEPVELDQVRVRSIAAQGSAKVVLQTAGGQGEWKPLVEQAVTREGVATPDLRRAAMAELYRRGFRYLFSMHYESYVQSMENDLQGWNVERAAHGGDWRIFRILPPGDSAPQIEQLGGPPQPAPRN